MGRGAFIVLGIVSGLVGTLPAGVPLVLARTRGRRYGVGRGLVGVIVSFVMLSAAVFVVRQCRREMTLAFGAAMACTFLAVFTAGGLRAMGDGLPRRNNEGE